MALSNAVALFIILTAAATLNAHGLTDIQTSSQAAEALRPTAGQFAFFIFALGIIATVLVSNRKVTQGWCRTVDTSEFSVAAEGA
jgi:Mn2+/Fe2+ NRAMP family transporter